MRPAIYAWLTDGANPEKKEEELKELEWFMQELAMAEREQLRIAPLFIGKSRADKLSLDPIRRCLGDTKSKAASVADRYSTVSSPVDPRASRKLRQSHFLPGVEDEDEAHDADEVLSMRHSRVFAQSAQQQGFRARIKYFAKALYKKAIIGESGKYQTCNQSLSAFLAVIFYCCTTYLAVRYYGASQAGTSRPDDQSLISTDQTGRYSCLAEDHPWLWLALLDALYMIVLALIMWSMQMTDRLVVFVVVVSTMSGAGLGFLLQYYLTGRALNEQDFGCFFFLGALFGAYAGAFCSAGYLWNTKEAKEQAKQEKLEKKLKKAQRKDAAEKAKAELRKAKDERPAGTNERHWVKVDSEKSKLAV